MGGLEDARRKVGKLLRLGAAGLLLSPAPGNTAPGGFTKPGSFPGEFHDRDRLPPRSQVDRIDTPQRGPMQAEEQGFDYNYSDDYESKPATEEEKATLEKWYEGNKKTFEEIKKREMTAFQDFVKLMKACGTKRTDVPEDPVLQGRLSEANEIFEDAKSYHALFMWSWKMWNGETPDKEVSEYEGGMKEYEHSLRLGRSAAEAFERLMREFPDTIEYLFDQTFCSTS